MPDKKSKNQQRKKKQPLVMMLFSVITISSLGVAGFSCYEMRNMQGKMDTVAAGSAEKVKEELVDPVYLPLETFTVSLKPVTADEERVLYIGVTLRLLDQESRALIEKFLPEIRSRLLVVISRQSAKDIADDEGKNRLINMIKEEVSKPLDKDRHASVIDVLFNAFIIR